MAVNKFVSNAVPNDGFAVSKYIIYSDGSVRFRLWWRKEQTTANTSYTSTITLPFNIDLSKYYSMSIVQEDQFIVTLDTAIEILSANQLKLHVLVHNDDILTTLTMELFAFI